MGHPETSESVVVDAQTGAPTKTAPPKPSFFGKCDIYGDLHDRRPDQGLARPVRPAASGNQTVRKLPHGESRVNALVTTNAEAFRASTDAAGLCKSIVVETAMQIQGRKYVKVEGWQAIAIAHGCTGSARDVERVEGGVRAIGEVRRMADGVVIAEAEGFVGEDEPTWFGGADKWGKALPKRADYAIRAMAQTRAISRACRSAFAHVVVMMNADLSTTPFEEVPLGGFDDDQPRNITPTQHARPEASGEAVKRLNAAQAKRIKLDETIGAAIWGCETLAALVEWERDFDKHTAQAPLGWLDAMRNDVILKRESLLKGTPAGDTEDEPGTPDWEARERAMDEEMASRMGDFPGDRETPVAGSNTSDLVIAGGRQAHDRRLAEMIATK